MGPSDEAMKEIKCSEEQMKLISKFLKSDDIRLEDLKAVATGPAPELRFVVCMDLSTGKCAHKGPYPESEAEKIVAGLSAARPRLHYWVAAQKDLPTRLG